MQAILQHFPEINAWYTWYTYLVYLVVKLTHYISALNFCFIEAMDWSLTVVSSRLFQVGLRRNVSWCLCGCTVSLISLVMISKSYCIFTDDWQLLHFGYEKNEHYTRVCNCDLQSENGSDCWTDSQIILSLSLFKLTCHYCDPSSSVVRLQFT